MGSGVLKKEKFSLREKFYFFLGKREFFPFSFFAKFSLRENFAKAFAGANFALRAKFAKNFSRCARKIFKKAFPWAKILLRKIFAKKLEI